MCSAPGSKTTHLAALMENQGKIEAYDLYKHKVKLIEHNLKRLGVKNVHVQAGDSTKLIEHYPPETFDRILLDAPCSGFGVLKRKPLYHHFSINYTHFLIKVLVMGLNHPSHRWILYV